jgi:RNase H-fold protein (predicted Holliday junction resolvase)
LEIENIAIPKEIVLRVNIIETLKKYFKEYKEIDTIVLGLPYDLY